jgi:hypothetical protein
MYGFAEGSTPKACFMNPKIWNFQMKRTKVNLGSGPQRHLSTGKTSLLKKTSPEVISHLNIISEYTKIKRNAPMEKVLISQPL